MLRQKSFLKESIKIVLNKPVKEVFRGDSDVGDNFMLVT